MISSWSDTGSLDKSGQVRSQPTAADLDAYILSRIIHDWDEDQCVTILSHIHKAIKSNGRLLIVEMVLPEGDTPHPGKTVLAPAELKEVDPANIDRIVSIDKVLVGPFPYRGGRLL